MGYRLPPPPVPPPGWDKMAPDQKAAIHDIDAKYHRAMAQTYRERRDSSPSFGGLALVLGCLIAGND